MSIGKRFYETADVCRTDAILSFIFPTFQSRVLISWWDTMAWTRHINQTFSGYNWNFYLGKNWMVFNPITSWFATGLVTWRAQKMFNKLITRWRVAFKYIFVLKLKNSWWSKIKMTIFNFLNFNWTLND